MLISVLVHALALGGAYFAGYQAINEEGFEEPPLIQQVDYVEVQVQAPPPPAETEQPEIEEPTPELSEGPMAEPIEVAPPKPKTAKPAAKPVPIKPQVAKASVPAAPADNPVPPIPAPLDMDSIASEFTGPPIDSQVLARAPDTIPERLTPNTIRTTDRNGGSVNKSGLPAGLHPKTLRRVRKVYPLALEAKRLLDELNLEYDTLPKNSDRRKLVKEYERQLLDRYLDTAKNMTTTEGIILVKLIARQTGQTPYDLIKNYRGSGRAVFFQTLSRLYKVDLKEDYDTTTNLDIELAIEYIENEKLRNADRK